MQITHIITMSPIRKIYWKLYLRFVPRMPKTSIAIELLPYMAMHNITTDSTGIHFHDTDMNLMMQVEGYTPIHSIEYDHIASVCELHRGRYLRILLRSGKFLLIDRHTPCRSCRSIFTEPRPPYPGEQWMWRMWRKLKRKVRASTPEY